MDTVNIKDDVIFREHLVQRLKTMSAKKNIYITAPGGYGKTVAAGQWISYMRKKTESITVTEADNAPFVFYKKLARALLILMDKAHLLPQANVSFDRLLDIINLLSKRHSRVYLLIDDLHMLDNEEIIGNLPLITARLPYYVCLCLISRSEPSELLTETGRFEVLTQNDLLFTVKEIKLPDGRLTPEDIGSLIKTTGGWAIYLSLLLSGKKYDETSHTLTEYLEKRVWGLWTRDTKISLLRLAVPNEITPELAERLTEQTDGIGLLERLMKMGNAFLSCDGGVYRFHDIFREFLLERLDNNLSGDEIRKLNNVTAEWYFGRGNYFQSILYFFKNLDHEGIIRCERAITVYNEETENISIEASYHFTSRNVMYMPMSFIAENPFLTVECCCASFWGGDMQDFTYWIDVLQEKLPEIAEKYPDIIETVGFLGSLDPRVPMLEYAKMLAVMMRSMGARETESATTNTITHNLPFFHRSMRDYSENYELKEEDLALYRNTFGVMIGKDYEVMEQSLIAGIYYERGELLKAARHAITGVFSCEEKAHPETWFSARMILAAVLHAMGALDEAGDIMDEVRAYIENRAQFLRPNFKALQTRMAIGGGGAESGAAAREWLEFYACRLEQLPFYQLAGHFATLRSYIALKDYSAAVAFGKRLQTLASDYCRPLDIIESGILVSVALMRGGEKEEATVHLGNAVSIAMPYGFTQLFVSEGMELLPLLWELSGNADDSLAAWLDKLIDKIHKNCGSSKIEATMLSAQQRAMLPYLNKKMSYGEIADATGVGYDTVKTHVRLLYRRLGVHSASEAVIKAKMLGLLDYP
ncbi:MAG: LuxR C-terminal-related transcriptional regulator [Oscillospiraceae bacterium]|nr:LuxR C-terminal-related transcriptional regulator [Oscillospiraceae bacterium]